MQECRKLQTYKIEHISTYLRYFYFTKKKKKIFSNGLPKQLRATGTCLRYSSVGSHLRDRCIYLAIEKDLLYPFLTNKFYFWALKQPSAVKTAICKGQH